MSFSSFDNIINSAITNTQTLPQSENVIPQKSMQIVSNPLSSDAQLLSDEFCKLKTKNGVFERIYNFFKNITGFGLGSKKVESKIDEYSVGAISKEAVENDIAKYKKSQKNAEQTFGNVMAAGATFGTFFLGKNLIRNLDARFDLNPIIMDVQGEKATKQGEKATTRVEKVFKLVEKIPKLLKSKSKLIAMSILPLAFIGGIVKYGTLKLNRIGSKEFVPDKNLKKTDKAQYKLEKKQLKKARFKQNFKNFMTGAFGGILTPMAAVAGGFVGVPAYVAGILGMKYLTNGNKDKSFKDFGQNLVDNYALNAVGAGTVLTLGLRKARFSNVLSKNYEKVVNNLKGVKLELPEYANSKTSYEQIQDILLNSEGIQKIRSDQNLDVTSKIQKLIEENFFAVKFLQTSGRSDSLVKTLIEDCPTTRSLEQAQAEINKLIGGKYTISKLLKVGTVAEVYLAKDKSGKEVCVKILKEGINADKIKRDKEAFINLVTKGKPKDQLSKEEDYLVRCIEDYANGVAKEIDFENEIKAAKELAKYTKKANVVKPIEAKESIYVMEKAKGISVATLKEYYSLEIKLKSAERLAEIFPEEKERVEKLRQDMQKIKDKSPDFADFELNNSELKKILYNYIAITTEQFSKIRRGEKVVHADIHPGNVIIDLDVVKGKSKGKMFTLIDTGNVINITKEQSIDMLKLSDYIRQGNIKDLSRSVLANSILPAGMSKEQAISKMEEELKRCFFDNKTEIEEMTIDNFFKLTDSIQRKLNIIPNNTQLNLTKAKNASKNSFKNLEESFLNHKYKDFDTINATDREMLQAQLRYVGDKGLVMKKYYSSQKQQEIMNLFKLSPSEFIKSIFNRNKPKANSTEVLTYKMKQGMSES